MKRTVAAVLLALTIAVGGTACGAATPARPTGSAPASTVSQAQMRERGDALVTATSFVRVEHVHTRAALIERLTSGGYSEYAATWAADHVQGL